MYHTALLQVEKPSRLMFRYSSIFHPLSDSPAQESAMCITDYPQTHIDATAGSAAALVRADFLPPDAFYSGPFLEEGDAEMRKRAESVSRYKLPTYQAAAVVVHTARIPFYM